MEHIGGFVSVGFPLLIIFLVALAILLCSKKVRALWSKYRTPRPLKKIRDRGFFS